jgi:hypothetical protein
LFDEEGSPGQTAKLFGLSAAGFDLAMNVGRENQGDSLSGREGGCLPEEGWRKYQEQQDPQKKFPHRTPHKKPARVFTSTYLFIEPKNKKASKGTKVPPGLISTPSGNSFFIFPSRRFGVRLLG